MRVGGDQQLRAVDLGQIEASDVTPLPSTGPEPLSALPDVPEGESAGISDLPAMPRGLILPPDVP